MISQNTFKDSRLLGALDYIDSGYISDAMKDLKIDIEESDTKSSKRRKIKAYLTLAACLILLSAAFPIVNYVLPRIGVAIGGNAGAGTSEEATLTYTPPVGEVPEEFRHIVEQNLFHRATVYRDRLIKNFKNSETGNTGIELLTFDGTIVAKHEFPTLTYGYRSETHMTEDGVILAVFGRGPVYPEPMHPYYPPASIIKIDLNGNILNEVQLDEEITVGALEYCFSTPEGYAFVGSIKKKNAPVRLYEYDIIVTTFDKNLNVTNQIRIGEDREHNNLLHASYIDGCLNVYKRSLIDTGKGVLKREEEFRKMVFDARLNLIEETVSDEYIDFKSNNISDGRYDAYYEKANLDDAAGYELIEYDDFDLIVANFHTADYELDYLSSTIDPLSLYRETVYSAYSKSGELLWRASVDSTDYELLELMLKEREEYSKFNAEYKNKLPENLEPYVYTTPTDTD